MTENPYQDDRGNKDATITNTKGMSAEFPIRESGDAYP